MMVGWIASLKGNPYGIGLGIQCPGMRNMSRLFLALSPHRAQCLLSFILRTADGLGAGGKVTGVFGVG